MDQWWNDADDAPASEPAANPFKPISVSERFEKMEKKPHHSSNMLIPPRPGQLYGEAYPFAAPLTPPRPFPTAQPNPFASAGATAIPPHVEDGPFSLSKPSPIRQGSLIPSAQVSEPASTEPPASVPVSIWSIDDDPISPAAEPFSSWQSPLQPSVSATQPDKAAGESFDTIKEEAPAMVRDERNVPAYLRSRPLPAKPLMPSEPFPEQDEMPETASAEPAKEETEAVSPAVVELPSRRRRSRTKTADTPAQTAGIEPTPSEASETDTSQQQGEPAAASIQPDAAAASEQAEVFFPLETDDSDDPAAVLQPSVEDQDLPRRRSRRQASETAEFPNDQPAAKPSSVSPPIEPLPEMPVSPWGPNPFANEYPAHMADQPGLELPQVPLWTPPSDMAYKQGFTDEENDPDATGYPTGNDTPFGQPLFGSDPAPMATELPQVPLWTPPSGMAYEQGFTDEENDPDATGYPTGNDTPFGQPLFGSDPAPMAAELPQAPLWTPPSVMAYEQGFTDEENDPDATGYPTGNDTPFGQPLFGSDPAPMATELPQVPLWTPPSGMAYEQGFTDEENDPDATGYPTGNDTPFGQPLFGSDPAPMAAELPQAPLWTPPSVMAYEQGFADGENDSGERNDNDEAFFPPEDSSAGYPPIPELVQPPFAQPLNSMVQPDFMSDLPLPDEEPYDGLSFGMNNDPLPENDIYTAAPMQPWNPADFQQPIGQPVSTVPRQPIRQGPAQQPQPAPVAADKPPIQPMRVVALVCMVLMVLFILLVGGRMLFLYTSNSAREGITASGKGTLVHLKQPGVTYEATVMPATAATPAPTAIININDPAADTLKKQALDEQTGEENAAGMQQDAPVQLRTRQEVYPDNPLLNILPGMEELHKEYPEVVGKLVIPGLMEEIVVQRNNTFYLTHNYRGTASEGGAVFVDESCNLKAPPENLQLRGNGSIAGKGFQPLWQYRDSEAFAADYGVVTLTTLYEERQFVLVAVIVTSNDPASSDYFNYKSYLSFDTDQEMLDYVAKARQHSLYPITTDVQPGDRLMTLSTVSSTGESESLVLLLRMIR